MIRKDKSLFLSFPQRGRKEEEKKVKKVCVWERERGTSEQTEEKKKKNKRKWQIL